MKNSLPRLASLGVMALSLSACENEPDVVDTTIEEVEAVSPSPMYDEAAVPIPEGSSTSVLSASQDALLEQYRDLESACRGGTGFNAERMHICARRDQMLPQMRSAELCIGREGDQSEAEMEWHVCRPDSYGYDDQSAATSVGTCRVAAEGRALLDGSCFISLYEDGSFSLLSEDERVYAAVNRYYEGPARASVSADNNYFENGGEFGDVERSGACWSNVTVEICAWR